MGGCYQHAPTQLSRLASSLIRGHGKPPFQLPIFRISCVIHAVLSLAAGITLLASFLWESGSSVITPSRLFEVDTLSSRALDAHAGFLLYSLIIYTRHSSRLKPPFQLTFLHHVGLLSCWLAAKVFPCTLTRMVLPLHELGAVAALARAWRDVSVMYGTSKRAHVKRLTVELAALAWKLVLATVATYWCWLFFRKNPLWSLLEERAPDLAAMSRIYSVLFLSCSAMLVLIYTLWIKDVCCDWS